MISMKKFMLAQQCDRTIIIDMHIHRLRAKLEQNGGTTLIHTVPGASYCLRTEPA